MGVGARPGAPLCACVPLRRRGAAGHPIHWHVDPDIKQEIAHYNARRRKNLAGWGAIDSLAGEGYKVASLSLWPPQPDARPTTCLAPCPIRGSALFR